MLINSCWVANTDTCMCKGFVEKRHLWVCSYFSSFVQEILYVLLPISKQSKYVDVQLQFREVLISGFITYHHHHVVPPARISLTLSPHFSLSFIASGRSSGLQPVSSHTCCIEMFELVVLLLLGHMWGSIRVYRLWTRPCFSSSVLHVWFV